MKYKNILKNKQEVLFKILDAFEYIFIKRLINAVWSHILLNQKYIIASVLLLL